MHYVGKINKRLYSCVTTDISTDELIITEKQVDHIFQNHPNDFIDLQFLNKLLMLDILSVFHKDISGNSINEVQSSNNEFKFVTFDVFHINNFGKEINDLHPLKRHDISKRL